MTTCPELATLIDVEAAADWRGIALVEHVGGCAECRAAMHDVESIHSSIAKAPPLSDAAVDELMLRLESRNNARVRVIGGDRLFDAVVFILGFVTMIALQLIASSAGGQTSGPVSMFVMAAIGSFALAIYFRSREALAG